MRNGTDSTLDQQSLLKWNVLFGVSIFTRKNILFSNDMLIPSPRNLLMTEVSRKDLEMN